MLAILSAPSAVAGDPTAALVLLFALVIGHVMGDYALQTEFIALAKNRHSDLSKFFKNGKSPRGMWIHALSAHCLIHSGAVWLITGSVTLALLEFILHFLIDFAKCEGKTNFNTDQFLHLACRVLYVILLYFSPAWITWTPA